MDTADPLPRERLLVVPGNHDVDRGKVNALAKMAQQVLLAQQDQNTIGDILGDTEQHRALIKRHAAYLHFRRDWFGKPQPLPWWQCGLKIGGQSLHLAGLDSAWMSAADRDRGALLLGRFQINQTVLHPDRAGADWHLALLHHPWDYLAEFDQRGSLESIHLHCDLVLHGHFPGSRLMPVQPPDPQRACIELAAGGINPGGNRPRGFQWIELQAQPRAVRVWFRCWNQGQWQPDLHQGDPGSDGMVQLQLDANGDDPQRPPWRAPEVPAAYLDWLRRTNARIELLGQDLPHGQAITGPGLCPGGDDATRPAAWRRAGTGSRTRGRRAPRARARAARAQPPARPPRRRLTSRPYGLSAPNLARLGLPSAPLEPLPEPLQALFVTRWFHALQQPALAPRLNRDLAGRPELAPLAGNPMLLKAMCIIYGSGQRLPEDKYRLYQPGRADARRAIRQRWPRCQATGWTRRTSHAACAPFAGSGAPWVAERN